MAWLLLLILPGGVAGVWRLQRKVSVERDVMYQEQDEVLVRSPKLMKIGDAGIRDAGGRHLLDAGPVQYYGNKQPQGRNEPGKSVAIGWTSATDAR